MTLEYFSKMEDNDVNNDSFSINFTRYLELIFVISVVFFVSFYLSKEDEKFLVIGIISAPEHFEQRLYQRKTWLRLAGPGTSIKYYFVIGRSICLVPPEDRVDPYGCEESRVWRVSRIWNGSKSENISSPTSCSSGIYFRTNHELKVTSLGVHKSVFDTIRSEPVRVKLRSGFSGEVLASATFIDASLKSIPALILARHFEGVLAVEGVGFDQISGGCYSKESGPGITVTGIIENGNFGTVKNDIGVLPTLNYEIMAG